MPEFRWWFRPGPYFSVVFITGFLIGPIGVAAIAAIAAIAATAAIAVDVTDDIFDVAVERTSQVFAECARTHLATTFHPFLFVLK